MEFSVFVENELQTLAEKRRGEVMHILISAETFRVIIVGGKSTWMILVAFTDNSLNLSEIFLFHCSH